MKSKSVCCIFGKVGNNYCSFRNSLPGISLSTEYEMVIIVAMRA